MHKIRQQKLNSISTLISKALNDGSISDREFSLIMDEFSRFQEMKNVIKIKTRDQIKQEMKDSLIEQGRREAREQLKNKITLELFLKRCYSSTREVVKIKLGRRVCVRGIPSLARADARARVKLQIKAQEDSGWEGGFESKILYY